MRDLARSPLLMGILNVTPDSFSDGGAFADVDRAVTHAMDMIDQGADIIDIGGESTRPGAARVSAAEQLQRVLPVLEMLKARLPAQYPISIDTTSAEVAAGAIRQGATMINDVSAATEDAAMLSLAADAGLPLVMMHMQGEPGTMQDHPQYTDVVAEVKAYLLARAEAAMAAGVKAENIIIDPGIGFGKTKQHNLHLIANLQEFVDTPYAVLLGASRKRFMGSICDVGDSRELLGATCATTALATSAGVAILRVHDIKHNRQARDVALALKDCSGETLLARRPPG